MEEINVFDDLAKKIMFLCGWLIKQVTYLFSLDPTKMQYFNSPLVFLSFGIFLIFASLHIFKRLLRKG